MIDLFGEERAAQHYLPLHNYFDASKAAYGDWRHRALRHHVEAFESACATLPDFKPENLREVCEQHLLEDLGRVATLSEWRASLQQIPPWAQGKMHDPLARARTSVKVFGGTIEDTLELHQWLDKRCLEDEGYGFWRHHAWGLFEAEAHFGVTVRVGGRPLGVRTVLERHLRDEFRRLPSAQDWLSHLKIESWMAQPETAAARAG